MIDASELRIGNYILHKTGVRILRVKITIAHFDLLGKSGGKDMFPIALKPDILQKCGFTENLKYYRLPEGREFILTLPVMGANKNEIAAYVINNSEMYARATVNDLVISNNCHHLHQLQNLYYALAGRELDVAL
jgi:hypothetical protein